MNVNNFKKLNFRIFLQKRKVTLENFFVNKNFYLYSRGREAIYDLASRIGHRKIFLPAYVPQGVYLPFKQLQFEIIFYDLEKNLQINLDELESLIRKFDDVKILLVIHYFGYRQPIKRIKEICNKNKILLIEDCAMTLFSDVRLDDLGSYGDFSLFSLNKIFPVIDGAVLIINKDIIFKPKYYFSVTKFIANIIYTINLILNDILFKESKLKILSKFLNIFNYYLYEIYYVLININIKPKRISVISKFIFSRLRVEELIENYRINYNYLLENLDSRIKLLDRKYDNNLILSLPIICENRSKLINELRKYGIICSKLIKRWVYIDDEVLENYKNTKYFIDKHLLLPVDLFKSKNEIEFLIEKVNSICYVDWEKDNP